MNEAIATVIAIMVIAFVCLLGIGGCMYVKPKYDVYQQTMAGEAALKRSESEKKVLIETAKAENEAATMKAQARLKIAEAKAKEEVIRAEGVAKANTIIGESLKGNDDYLRYLWIQGLQDGSSEVIYIPTEAGLPILEAGKRK